MKKLYCFSLSSTWLSRKRSGIHFLLSTEYMRMGVPNRDWKNRRRKIAILIYVIPILHWFMFQTFTTKSYAHRQFKVSKSRPSYRFSLIYISNGVGEETIFLSFHFDLICFPGIDYSLLTTIIWFQCALSGGWNKLLQTILKNQSTFEYHVYYRYSTSGRNLFGRVLFFCPPEKQDIHVIEIFLFFFFKINAVANRAAGKGYENEDYYSNIHFKICPIENIHTMRNSLQKLIESKSNL